MMKRLLCLLLALLMTLSLTACGKNDTEDKGGDQDQAEENPLPSVDPQRPDEENGGDEPLPDDEPQQSPAYTETGYIVNDPDNTRGLSEEAVPFSFGAAKNGEPHSQSVRNQDHFDSMANVSALALDRKTAKEEKVLYLTFDCGYEYNNNTLAILDVLKEKNVKAAFFCTLPFLTGNGTSAQRMIDEGHIVGNHSNNHPVFPTISRTKMAQEIFDVHQYLLDTYGYTSKYFRFPTGSYSESSLELVTSIGYNSVFWSIAYDDWDTNNQGRTDYAFKTVTGRLHPGAVILLHSVSTDNTEILDDFIDYARKEGYTFKTLDDYFA